MPEDADGRGTRTSEAAATFRRALTMDFTQDAFATGRFMAFAADASSADNVKSLSPNHRCVIALHSPSGVVETGLRVARAVEFTTPPRYPLASSGVSVRADFNGDGRVDVASARREVLSVIA